MVALVPLSGWLLTTVGAREVFLLVPHAPEVVEANRLMWSVGEPVAGLYGIPASHPVRVVFPNKAKLIVPEEDPSLTLLVVDKQAGDNPLQAKTVWYVVRFSLLVCGVVALAGGFLAHWFRRSRAVDLVPRAA